MWTLWWAADPAFGRSTGHSQKPSEDIRKPDSSIDRTLQFTPGVVETGISDASGK